MYFMIKGASRCCQANYDEKIAEKWVNTRPRRQVKREKMPGIVHARRGAFQAPGRFQTALPWVPELHRQSLEWRKSSDPVFLPPIFWPAHTAESVMKREADDL
jgi:hypothetical protein